MIDRIADFAQALWLLAFGFYAIDVARLVTPGRLLLREAGGARLAPVLASFPFEIARKELSFAGFLMPWRGVLLARWDGGPVADAQPLAQVQAVLGRLRLARGASAANALLLFVAGPVLTLRLGLGYALLLVAPAVYLLNLVTGLDILRRRAVLGLTGGRAAWLLADALLCAPYGANWTQRITRLLPELAESALDLRTALSPADYDRLAALIALRRSQPGATEP